MTDNNMLTADMFTGFADVLTGDLLVILPIAISVMGVLWGLRIAISYFKGIAN